MTLPDDKQLSDILGRLARLEDNLEMREAAQKQDWDKVAALIEKGADVSFRYSAVVDLILEAGSPEALQLFHRLDAKHRKEGADWRAAIKAGRRDSVEYLLESPHVSAQVAEAFAYALEQGRDGMADLLFPHLQPQDVSDRQLEAVLRAGRSDFYFKMRDMPPAETPDYLAHFFMASQKGLQDVTAHLSAAINSAWLNQLPERLKNLELAFDVSARAIFIDEKLREAVKLGNVEHLEKFLDILPRDKDLQRKILLAAAANGSGESLEYCLNRFAPEPDIVSELIDKALVAYASGNLRILLERHLPHNVLDRLRQEEILSHFITDRTPENYFWAVEQGLSFRLSSHAKTEAAILAMHKGHKDIVSHIVENHQFSRLEIDRFRDMYDFEVLEIAARLDNDIHFQDDKMFWQAARNGNEDFIRAFPEGRYASTANPFRMTSAMDVIAKSGDMHLFDMVMEKIEPTPANLRKVLGSCLASHDMVKKVVEMGVVPDALLRGELGELAVKGKIETILYLEQRGFTCIDESPVNRVAAAVYSKNPGMAEFLIGRAPELLQDTGVLVAVEGSGNKEDMQMVKKWYMRQRSMPAPALSAEIFEETGALAVHAAYADRFSLVVSQLEAAGKLAALPEKLVATRDEHGNTLLDILGAHGRLNDVMVPEVWQNRDCAEFMREHVPAGYLKQCDFTALKAGLDRLRLKSTAQKNKFKFKSPGL